MGIEWGKEGRHLYVEVRKEGEKKRESAALGKFKINER
jgi:hypothetical protein